ncbi:hypothetical protein ACWEN6_24560 [Sphaerisporangium sp. NPDC004334]
MFRTRHGVLGWARSDDQVRAYSAFEELPSLSKLRQLGEIPDVPDSDGGADEEGV